MNCATAGTSARNQYPLLRAAYQEAKPLAITSVMRGFLARDVAKTAAYKQSRKDRKKVEMVFARLKRILKLDRLHLRGPNGAHDEFLLAAIAQSL